MFVAGEELHLSDQDWKYPTKESVLLEELLGDGGRDGLGALLLGGGGRFLGGGGGDFFLFGRGFLFLGGGGGLLLLGRGDFFQGGGGDLRRPVEGRGGFFKTTVVDGPVSSAEQDTSSDRSHRFVAALNAVPLGQLL